MSLDADTSPLSLDPFADWAKDSTDPCIVNTRDRLIELGVTWRTFSRPAEEVARDLVEAGFPSASAPSSLLAARDVVHAACAALARDRVKAATPLAVFWDVENVNIPREKDTQELIARLKACLRPFGMLKEFRAYCSVTHTLGGASQEQRRSDMQLAGVHIVDTPHMNRKEVADKMIIVDAMEFAYEHPDGAAIAIITADTDFAYLLARLQRRPDAWRTILISKGTMRTMLHANATTNLRWETDVLQIRHNERPTRAPLHVNSWVAGQQQLGNVRSPPPGTPMVPPQPVAPVASMGSRAVSHDFAAADDGGAAEAEQREDLDAAAAAADDGDDDGADLQTLTEGEQDQDDFALLRFVYSEIATLEGRGDVLKANVGNALRQKNRIRFPDRNSIQEFLARAVDPHTGVMEELGTGAQKRLRMRPVQDGAVPLLEPQDGPAVEHVVSRATEKLRLLAAERPWGFAFPYAADPDPQNSAAAVQGAFIANTPTHRFALFRSQLAAMRAADAAPFLRTDPRVVFFDWRRVSHLVRPAVPREQHSTADIEPAAAHLSHLVHTAPQQQLTWAMAKSVLMNRYGYPAEVANAARNLALERGSITAFNDDSTPPNPYVRAAGAAPELALPDMPPSEELDRLLHRLRELFNAFDAGDTLYLLQQFARRALASGGQPIASHVLNAVVERSAGEFVVVPAPGSGKQKCVTRASNAAIIPTLGDGCVTREPFEALAMFVSEHLQQSGVCSRIAMTAFLKTKFPALSQLDRIALLRAVQNANTEDAELDLTESGQVLKLRAQNGTRNGPPSNDDADEVGSQ